MRVALGLEYCGRSFTGWQSQPDGRGVQDALERALAKIADARVRTIAAGRTDAGVHATMQVVHFDCRRRSARYRVGARRQREPARRRRRAVGDSRGAGIPCALRRARAPLHVPAARARPVRPALSAGRIGWYHRSLDVAAMQEGAAALVGTHDFSAFRAAECQANSPRCARCERVDRRCRRRASASIFAPMPIFIT